MNRPDLARKLSINSIFQLIEKLVVLSFSFVNMYFLIKMLSPDDYGIWGVAFGYFAFLQIINVGTESILWKHHNSMQGGILPAMRSIEAFNIIKFFVLLLLAVFMGYILSSIYANSNFIYALVAATSMMAVDSLVSHLATVASANYKHSIVTRVNFNRVLFSLVLMLLFIYNPTMQMLMLKELAIAMFVYGLWHRQKKNVIGAVYFPTFDYVSLLYVWKSIRSYSIWTHFCGVLTYFIYRSDTIFLSMVAGLPIVGHYNIALNLANLANIIPGIIAQQNSVAISNVDKSDVRNKITLTLLKVSILFGVFILLIYVFLAEYVVMLISEEAPSAQIYSYLIPIVVGLLIVKTIASPIVSLINISGSVRRLFFRVNLPTFLLSIIFYSASAFFCGAIGLAYSNIIVSLVWLALLLREASIYGFSLKGLLSLKYEIKFLKGIFIK